MRAIRKVYCRWAAAPLSRMACFCSASEDHMGRPSAVFQSGQRHTGILAYAISKGVNRIEGVVGRILEIRRRDVRSGAPLDPSGEPGGSGAVITYCVMASPDRLAARLCLHVIPEVRHRRGSHFCSHECHTEYRRGRVAERAERKCRLCGRRMPRKDQSAGWRNRVEWGKDRGWKLWRRG